MKEEKMRQSTCKIIILSVNWDWVNKCKICFGFGPIEAKEGATKFLLIIINDNLNQNLIQLNLKK
jgi:hypothetical protein